MDSVAGHGRPRRLSIGLHRLERWADTASQVEKNAAYKALFAVSNGSVFRAYPVLDDLERAQQFVVLVREDLVIKIRLGDTDAFGIEYIGSPSAATDHDLGTSHEA